MVLYFCLGVFAYARIVEVPPKFRFPKGDVIMESLVELLENSIMEKQLY